ncbi:carbohydrate kinase, partial [Salmonella enterica subsp. enterica]|nr:carbohydrate kinase [Salmonella enterica subsp. enterica serovar Enteritidis]
MIICVGGAVLDRKYRARAPIVAATSNPADGFRSFGGVGRNICENLARLGAETGFVSVVGDDENGRAIIDHLKRAGADTRHVGFSGRFPTAEYVAVLEPTNDLALGIADMSIFEELGPLALAPALTQAKAGDWVLFDCNLPQETIEWLAGERGKAGFRLACDTVST